LTNLQKGKYFRVVANVLVDGVSLEQGDAYGNNVHNNVCNLKKVNKQ